jgi:hypothetical protein
MAALRLSFACAVVVLLQVSSVFAVVHSLVPPRAQGGRLFAALQAAENEAHAKYGIYTNSTANYFQQLIDHANPARGVFNQRYFLDFSNWNPESGPVFLYIGGEGPLTQSPGGYLAVVAKEQQGLIVALEHRYYGVSLPAPLGDRETLRTLNVETALADLIHFISFVQETYLGSKPRRWVSVGGSYPGALSAWFRIKYPQIITASWSSSGVVNAVFSFDQFDRTLVTELDPDCANAIRAVVQQAETGWANPAERARMLALFNTPSYFTREDFLWMLADSAAMGPQYGFRTELCAAMLPLQRDPIAQFAINWTLPHYGADFGGQCYYSTVCLSDAKYSSQWPNQLPWVYQCCNELAYWQIGYPGARLISSCFGAVRLLWLPPAHRCVGCGKVFLSFLMFALVKRLLLLLSQHGCPRM